MATGFENVADRMASGSTSSEKPIVVGIYGISGSGKSYLLKQLRQKLEEPRFLFYEGSEVIDSLTPGGLDAFKKLNDEEKNRWRQLAIDTIRQEAAETGRMAIVAGHFMFCSAGEEFGQPVYTKNDLETFTYILYLDASAQLIAQCRLDNKERDRPSLSTNHLHKW
ncbi:hypothetical protein TWF506_004527 [Arthrobotrys conoides]|uniref:Uncharacterized protein n=1 Tax=Arthrobotrys conoides TaxID=74498 RepID=A0AAN8N0V4_9PEZI